MAIALVAVLPASAGAQPLQVSNPAIVARESEPRRFVEPHLAVHPANPAQWLAGVMVMPMLPLVQDRIAGSRCAALVSQDTGANWKRHDFPFVECWDPQVAIFPDGKAVFVALARFPGIQPRGVWLIAMHSMDAGTTWEPDPTIVAHGSHDHPSIAVDVTSGRRKGWMYITSHYQWRDGNGDRTSGVWVGRSRNGGRSFDAPEIIVPNRLHTLAETPVVFRDGTLAASWVDGVYVPPPRDTRSAWLALSSDGGSSFSMPSFVTQQCGPPPGFQLSDLAVDRSEGPFRDRLYFACRQRGGGPIVVLSSSDRGASWSNSPTPVPPTTIDSSARRVMNLRVNAKGVVGALVVEKRPVLDGACLHVTFSASFDGAASFPAHAELSSSRCTRSQNDSIASATPTYGDYFGLVAAHDDSFRVMWPEMHDGRSVLKTAVVRPVGLVAPPLNSRQ